MNRRALFAAATLAGALGGVARAQGIAAPARAVPARFVPDPETASDFQRRAPDDARLTFHPFGLGDLTLYGGERLNLTHDSTQSLGPTAHDNPIAAPDTEAGAHGRWAGSGADSRWGLELETPATERVGGVALVELGIRPSDTAGRSPVEARQLFLGARTPVVDVLLGRTHELFGWGGRVPFPNTIASLGVPGEIYRQRAQLRLTHVFRFTPVDFEIAGAAVTPFQIDGYSYERQLGLRLAVNGWAGASDQAGGPAATMPAQLAISGTRRRFAVPEFSATPRGSYGVVGDGLALDAFVPLYPSHGDDLSNAASLTLEVSRGTGIADLYSGASAGAENPALPNPQMTAPPPTYRTAVPPGVVAFDGVGGVHTINWRALVLNLRYHLPIARGRRVWLAATWSRATSSNLFALTPPTARLAVYPDSRYVDATAFVAVWRGLQACLSFQVTRQLVVAEPARENRRAQLLVAYYF